MIYILYFLSVLLSAGVMLWVVWCMIERTSYGEYAYIDVSDVLMMLLCIMGASIPLLNVVLAALMIGAHYEVADMRLLKIKRRKK